MAAPYVVGVDVGGTNTDAVILVGKKVLSSCKRPTTADKTQGVVDAIQGALDALQSSSRDTVIQSTSRVSIGTTHFVNAVVERARDKLSPVAAIRLCGPASRSLPPFVDFPSDLKKLLCGRVYMVEGGLECSGREISPVNQEELKRIAAELLAMTPPLKNVVITGVFSPLDAVEGGQEREAAAILRTVSPDFSCTLSSGLGMLGLLERENAAILNESLKPLASDTITAFRVALNKLGFNCPFSLTQNDGTLISADDALQFPVLTFSSGPTNSMRGAMFLSGVKDAIVVDIGGTTTDVGVLKNGFPREASSQVKVGGVRTNFQMPDVLSIGLGGGSVVSVNNDNSVDVGPESVQYELITKALCFGGDTCTATDVAVAAGIAEVCTPPTDFPTKLSASTVYKGMVVIHNKLESCIDQVKIEHQDMPVLLVGGGTVLVDRKLPLKGVSKLIIPPHFSVANAVGAALGTVAGTSEVVESLSTIMASIGGEAEEKSKEEQQQQAREVAIQRGKDRAVAEAMRKGAVPESVFIHELSASSVTYIPDALRVYVKAIGSLTDDTAADHAASSSPSAVLSDKPLSSNAGVTGSNPLWPYVSEDDKRKDEVANLPTPNVNSATGEWIFSSHDVECLSVGAGILGCGGGGDPNVGRAAAQQLLSEGKKICLVDPHRVDPSSFGAVVSVAFMGAPVVLTEKLVAGTETSLCLTTMQQILATEMCEEVGGYGQKDREGVSLTTRTVSSGNKMWLPDCKKLPEAKLKDSKVPLHRRVTALLCAEAGGVNSFEPLLVGARLGLPVLDADGMGRAFPELQMFLPFINGLRPYPACVADEKGDVVAVTNVSSAKDLEEFFRIECVRMGMTCGISIGAFSLDEVLRTCVVYSLSQAWQLGRAIARARVMHTNVVDAVVNQQNGLLLITGKVIDVNRRTEAGFTGSLVLIEGLDKFAGHRVRVTTKNENLLAQELLLDDSVGKLLACIPDLVTIIDTDTGYPITTEDMRYGLRVSVVAVPAHCALTTPLALKVVGPSGFGFTDITYHPPVELSLS